MTPQQKAQELVDKYSKFDFSTLSVIKQREYVKQCALIAVDEMIDYSKIQIDALDYNYSVFVLVKYWQDVKTELEKL